MHRVAYDCVDMQVQLYVNAIKPGEWFRCRDVQVSAGELVWEADWERRYMLANAYRLAPHVRFLNLKTDRDFRDFVTTYGPLTNDPRHTLASYQRFQAWLRATLMLIKALERSRKGLGPLRDALAEFFRVTPEGQPSEGLVPGYNWESLLAEFSVPYDPAEWVPRSDLSLVRAVARVCLKDGLWANGGLDVALRRGGVEVTAGWSIFNLRDALIWMCWHDLYRRRPLVICDECRTVLQTNTAHKRKYCSTECAHRVAAREWRRRDLRKKKQGARRRQ